MLRSNVVGWFRERIDLGPFFSLLAKKTVPVHRHSWVYLLGGLSLFLVGLQVASGALLMLYYQPTEAAAHESVEKIMTEVPLGSVVRSVHVWGANFLIAVVGLHFLVKLFTRAYRKPREMTWISGALLLFAALVSGFSGYLLPWNDLSYYATLVGTQIPGTVPVVGEWIVHFLRGSQQVTGDTITRFFAAHVIFLPLLFGLLMTVHLGLIQAQGMSLPLGMPRKKVRDAAPFFSEFLLVDACVWLFVLGTIITLATLLPAEVGVKADPLTPAPPGIRPEWYFLFMFQTLKHVPEAVGVLLFAVGGLFLFAVPFLDRKAMREERSPWLTALFVLMVACAAVLEIVAWAAPGPQSAPGEVAGTVPSMPSGAGTAANVVSLTLFWTVICFLAFYLLQLRKQNKRIRQRYRTARGEGGEARAEKRMESWNV